MTWHAWAFLFGAMFTSGLCGALGAVLAFKWFTRGGVVFAVKECRVLLNGEVMLVNGPPK